MSNKLFWKAVLNCGTHSCESYADVFVTFAEAPFMGSLGEIDISSAPMLASVVTVDDPPGWEQSPVYGWRCGDCCMRVKSIPSKRKTRPKNE